MTPRNASVARRKVVAWFNKDRVALFLLQFGEHFLQCRLEGGIHADDNSRLLTQQRNDITGETGNFSGTMTSTQGREAGREHGKDKFGQTRACLLDRITHVRISPVQTQDQVGDQGVALSVANCCRFCITLAQSLCARGSTGFF